MNLMQPPLRGWRISLINIVLRMCGDYNTHGCVATHGADAKMASNQGQDLTEYTLIGQC